MIKLRSPLTVEADRHGGWQLIFWVGEPFDFTTPFRSMLGDIADQLGQNSQSDLHLPIHETGEDFVEGTLQFGTRHLRIYFEYSLGYLALMADNELPLQDVVDRVQPIVTVA